MSGGMQKEGFSGPVVDGSEEAEQVRIFFGVGA